MSKSKLKLNGPRHPISAVPDGLGAVTIAIPKLIKLDLSFGSVPVGHAFSREFDPDSLSCDDWMLPWPCYDGSIGEVYSAFFFNRVPGRRRFHFMDELWRVLILGGKATIIVPYWTSPRAIQDPMAEWPPLCEQSFLYFNKQFRENNKVYTEAKCDFDFTYGFQFDAEAMTRNDEARAFWLKHYFNVANDLWVTLTKRP